MLHTFNNFIADSALTWQARIQVKMRTCYSVVCSVGNNTYSLIFG